MRFFFFSPVVSKQPSTARRKTVPQLAPAHANSIRNKVSGVGRENRRSSRPSRDCGGFLPLEQGCFFFVFRTFRGSIAMLSTLEKLSKHNSTFAIITSGKANGEGWGAKDAAFTGKTLLPVREGGVWVMGCVQAGISARDRSKKVRHCFSSSPAGAVVVFPSSREKQRPVWSGVETV